VTSDHSIRTTRMTDLPTRRLTILPQYNDGDDFSQTSETDPDTICIAIPSITPSPRWTEHHYTMTKKGRTWLTLVLKSKANKPEELPYFFGHAPITGRVEIDLTSPEYISGVVLEVCIADT
jgi:hypothetical protein